MGSRMELLTTMGPAPSLSITWVSCVAPTLKLETAEATDPSTLGFPTKTVLGHFDQITECKHSFAFCVFPLASLFRRLGSAIPWYTGTSCSATSCFSGRWISLAWGAGSSFLAMALLKKHQESCPLGHRLQTPPFSLPQCLECCSG